MLEWLEKSGVSTGFFVGSGIFAIHCALTGKASLSSGEKNTFCQYCSIGVQAS